MDGRFLHTPERSSFAPLPTFSSDGKHAAWQRVSHPSGYSSGEIVSVLLNGAAPRPRATGTRIENWSRDLVLSADGTLIAASGKDSVSVYELDSARLLASVRLPDSSPASPSHIDEIRTRMSFLESRALEIYRLSPSKNSEDLRELQIFDLDLKSKRLGLRATLEGLSRPFPIEVSADHRRLLIRENPSKRITLRDSRTGEPVRVLAEADSESRRWANFLSDGRIALAEAKNGEARLTTFSLNGETLRTITLGPGERIVLGGEQALGKLIVGVGRKRLGDFADQQIFLVDIDSGQAERRAEDLAPALLYSEFLSSDPSQTFSPGSFATRLFYGRNGSLVDFDAITGKRKMIVPAGGS